MRRFVAGNSFFELFAWYGVVAILVAYALVSFDVLESDSITFQMMNLTGALGIAAVSLLKRVFQSVVLNVIWSLIALVAILNIII